MIKNRTNFSQLITSAILLSVLLLTACSEKMVSAGIKGYNHTTSRPIYNFTINGQMGHNISPGGGGGSESCCVSLPRRWHSGLKANVTWVYDSFQNDTNPRPPPQEIEVEIPEYKHPGNIQAHFYDNHKVKIIVSRCGLGHPFYPMNLQDQLPWAPEYSKDDAIESFKKGGPNYEC